MSSIDRRTDDEREPLLRREELNEKGHYNLAGLSFQHFWILVRVMSHRSQLVARDDLLQRDRVDR